MSVTEGHRASRPLGELAVELEELFGIELEEGALDDARSAGDLLDLVGGLVRETPRTSLLSRRVFYRLRGGIAEALGLEPGRITPLFELFAALPEGPERKRAWSEIARSSGLELPSLARPRWLETSILLAWLLTLLGAVALMIFVSAALGLALLGLDLVLLWLSIEWTETLALEPPEGSGTVGELCRIALLANAHTLAGDIGDGSPAETWARLAPLVAPKLGLAPAELRPETRLEFVEPAEG